MSSIFPRAGTVRAAAFISLMSMFLVGCGSNATLDTVRTLAKDVSDSGPGLVAVTHDYYLTCLRFHVWKFGVAPQPAPSTSANESPLSPTETAVQAGMPGASQAVPTNPNTTPAVACVRARDQSQQWEDATNLLMAYVKALGDLAGDSVSANYGFSTLAGSIATVSPSLFSAPQIAIITALAGLLEQVVKEHFAGKRRTSIQSFALEANDKVLGLIDLLDKTTVIYRSHLALERDSIDLFFKNVDAAAQRGGTGEPVLRTLPYRSQWLSALQAVDQKDAAVDSYRGVLVSIKRVQGALTKASWDPQVDLLEQARVMTNALKHHQRVLSEAFPK